MHLEFHGAVGETTGSMHVLQMEDKRILLDCGLYQGKRSESREKNLKFSFNPADIHSLVLSHAHIDHCGNIPNLVKQGFKGNVYTTKATQDLCGALLRDSAHIQEKDTAFLNKRLEAKGKPLIAPLYTMDDVEVSLERFFGVPYERTFYILRDLCCKYMDAGHILGSAFSLLDVNKNGSSFRLLFSGDIGRKNLPILKDPATPEKVDYMIMETTYGDRLHDNIEDAEKKLAEVVQMVYKRNGKIIIPSFSVGRTQELVFALHKLEKRKEIPPMPIFVDSPLSVNATEIFRQHQECFDKETMGMINRDEDPFGFEKVKYIRKVEQSKELNDFNKPCIIISASGMCESGRILHHLKNNIEDPKNLIMIVGFQAQNTLGRRLVEKQEEIKIFGDIYKRRAEVKTMNYFSAHADRDELVQFAKDVAAKSSLRKIFLVHGEAESTASFKTYLEENLKGPEVIIPERGMEYQL